MNRVLARGPRRYGIFPRMRRVAWLSGCVGVVLVGLVGLTVAACKGPMAKIEAVRDSLEKDDASSITSAIDGYPACADAPPAVLLPNQPSPRDTGCFAEIANALGSKKGFSPKPPDQAAAATVAVVLLRDGRGDWVAHSEDWLGSLKVGKGPGPDALRLAIARKMAEAAPRVGRPLEEEKDAREAMKAVAGAIPGACPTYWLIGSGSDPTKLAAELSAEHAACVHKDLGRREGPGSSYGSGTFRALEGSLALWRETERALRLGLGNAGPGAKATLENKLKIIEPATQAIATKKVASASPAEAVAFLGDVHADAGILLWKDAGADGGADGGRAGDGPKK
jgi:hypothetical protein